MRRSRIVMPLVLGATLATAACGGSGGATASSTSASQSGASANYSLNELDATTSLLNVPTFGVQQNGAQYHVTVKSQAVTGGGTANQEFAGGTGDLLVAGVDSPIRITQQGVTDMTVLGSIAQTNVWVLVTAKGSPIHSLKDLVGKTVGVSGAGAVSDIALRYELKKAGVDPSSVHIVALGAAPSQLAALEGGHADAVQLLSPSLESALNANQAQILLDMRKENYPALVVSARTSDVKAHPQAYCAYMAALKAQMTKVINDKAYAASTASALVGSTTSAADIQTVLTDYTKNRYDPTVTFTQKQYDTAKALLTDSGVVPSANFPSYQDLTKGQPKC